MESELSCSQIALVSALPLRVDIKEFFLLELLSILSLASAIESRRVGFQVLRVLNWNHEAHGVTREQS
ncbi:hypothetical protein, partial [Endozoicomonas sp. ONNA2]|uniref:hypothetical protein n=1 Tax=Endozoicomonas sp. ONNA2 TaxID=2828741 RepID=UPI0021499057